METVTQEDAILDYLMQGKSITPLDALNLFGCFRLAAVIHRLRRENYNIETAEEVRNGKRFARYSLIRPVQKNLL